MIITKKHISRRTMLRGMGVTMSLPFLDAMVPAGTAYAQAMPKRVRLAAIEIVHGAAGSTAYGAQSVQPSVGSPPSAAAPGTASHSVPSALTSTSPPSE